MITERTVWEFVPASAYAAPSGSGDSVPGGRLGRLWKRFRSLGGRPEDGDDAPDLDALTQERLESMTPDPDWVAAAEQLDLALGGSAAPETAFANQPLRAVVGPPGAGVGETVAALARRRGWPIFDPPPRLELLESSERLTAAIAGSDAAAATPLVIPHLEWLFLRHEAGLVPLRRLLRELWRRGRPTLVGCDGWAWAFLDRAVEVAALFDEPLVAAPFDGVRLDAWLGAPFRASPISCRQVGTGVEVFGPEPVGAAVESKAGGQVSPALDRLAAASRGVPEVALALWEASLGTAHRRSQEAQEGTPDLWVERFSEVRLPRLPTDAGTVDRFTLQALLVHGGLDREELFAALPLPAATVMGRLRRLEVAGMVEVTPDGGWTVAHLAYAAVRADLKEEGFLIDAL